MKFKRCLALFMVVAMVFTVLAINASAKVSTVVTANAKNVPITTDNVIANGSFENALSTGTLGIWEPISTSVTSDTAIDGAKCIVMKPGATSGQLGATIATDLLQGEAYKLTVYSKQKGLASYSSERMIVYFQGVNPSPMITFDASTPGYLAGGWVKQEMYFNKTDVTNGSHIFHFMRFADNTDNTYKATIYVDNVSLQIIKEADIPKATATPKPTPKPVIVKAPLTPKLKTTTIKTTTTSILGTTSKYAYVKLVISKKTIVTKKADVKGSFTLKVSLKKIKKGTTLSFYAYNLKGKTEVKSKTISVKLK